MLALLALLALLVSFAGFAAATGFAGEKGELCALWTKLWGTPLCTVVQQLTGAWHRFVPLLTLRKGGALSSRLSGSPLFLPSVLLGYPRRNYPPQIVGDRAFDWSRKGGVGLWVFQWFSLPVSTVIPRRKSRRWICTLCEFMPIAGQKSPFCGSCPLGNVSTAVAGDRPFLGAKKRPASGEGDGP